MIPKIRDWRTWLPFLFLVLGLLAYPIITATLGHNLSTQQIQNAKQEAFQYEHNTWCNAMDLLTAEPVTEPKDPAANPSREKDYQFYVTFETIKRRLKC